MIHSSSSSSHFKYFIWLLLPLFGAYLLYPYMMAEQHQQQQERQVLPTCVKPLHYDLWLKPHLDTFVFDGHVKVNLAVNEETNVITLNTREIKIISATLAFDDAVHSSTEISYDPKKTLAFLTFPEAAPAQTQAVLDIKFEGILNDQMTGFYRSSYKDDQGNTKYLATTQFQPTDARRAFPCWDEPSLKATYDVTLVVPTELTALSNMNVIQDEELKGDSNDGWKQVKYATTPVMSTYLLAFVVGPFDYIEAYTSGKHNGNPIQTRVYTLPGSTEQGRLALDVAVEALEFFAEQFGEPYPLPKMDMVAIPDFEAGAMENWGLVTFQTVYLLFDERASSIQSKKRVAYVVCHELAHQWFGNLVTMQWWNELYLNEAFATWVGWLAVDHIYPEWDIWTSFVNDDMPRALKLDALRSSHAIEVDVADASEIHQIFDAISYDKGASVIRMLSSWLGVDTFLAGVRRYIQKHKLGNASSNDLWMALYEETGMDVSKFMTLWTKHVGYPVLTVESSGPDSIKVTQSRFLSTGDLNAQDEVTTWWVPLHLLCSNGEVKPYILTEPTQTFEIPSDGIFKLNAGQTALYRVHYPQSIILRLAEEIKKQEQGLLASTADRVGLIDDVASLMVSGEQSTSAFLDLIGSFKNEKEYFVWSQLAGHLKALITAWSEQPKEILDGLLSIREQLFGPLADHLGWDVGAEENDLTNLLRVLAISNAGLSKHQATIQEAKRRFWSYVQGDSDVIHPNLRSTVFSIVLAEMTNDKENDNELTRAWEAVLKIYQDESLPTDQRLMALTSLGYTRDADLIERYLKMALDESQVRGQDAIYIYRGLSDTIDGRGRLYNYFIEHFDTLQTKFGKNVWMFGNILQVSLRGYASFDKLNAIKDFFKDKDTKEFQRRLQQLLESTHVRAKWVERDSENVRSWILSK
ncbi:peptidase family M1-domain-containing protein [Chlamydoabsidia padenii]|nr:peptidase family M1-domain-containing protein [Chlamydoabsidia padenii]